MSKKSTGLSLQSKVSMTLLITIAAFAVFSYIALTRVIAPAFDDLEMSEAETNLVRAKRALYSGIDKVSALTSDWA